MLRSASLRYIALLFLVSGFSALIYQVVWQRTLFATFGINSESVTVIVSLFMFGLGLGALAGGYLQQRFPRHRLRLFLLLELGIGAFGLVSLELIGLVSAAAGDTTTPELVLWVYLILAIPTLMMGATLPILVAWLQGYPRNIGQSVGLLYAVNTIGSAIAAWCTVELLFVHLGQQATVLAAAACNFATAALIVHASRRLVREDLAAVEAAPRAPGAAPLLPYPLVAATLLAFGYISLSQEILWFRMLGFMTANRPEVFGLMLAAFLVGIAGGSMHSRRACAPDGKPVDYLVRALFLAIAVFYLALPVVAATSAYVSKAAGTVMAYIAIAAVAFFTGGILPMLMHLGIADDGKDAASAMSWLYFANIAGATLGPLVTGFILLDLFSLEANIAVLSALTALLLLVLLVVLPKERAYRLRAFALMAVIAAGACVLHSGLYAGHLERLQHGKPDRPRFAYIHQNRSGIITVETDPRGDIMYGNGIYDGRYNLDLLRNSNLIDRAYMIASLHRKPARVLEIGLSTGSWAKVIADYRAVESLTIVEINKGYVDAMQRYPEIAGVLEDPKVRLHIDDGRRWLRNHPAEKFDLIVMNTTYYWRSNATNLLSVEFLELAKQRLKSGGVVYYNTTGSPDVVYTAAHVFKHVTLFSNFVAASDAPLALSYEERRANLMQFGLGQDAQHRAELERLASVPLPEVHDAILRRRALWKITDDNMAVEFKVR
ncbi:methyltransferase domain-containing protein [Massilia sp. TWR1-2-2]|uniref:spermine/spermidine synthase domain-containing protein n=1 Tax=Massilia sp. TWR1-2-2 TaxID=2804584 RepID=UPI003CEE5390